MSTADEAHVEPTLPTRTHVPFARFVAGEVTAGRGLDLDDLLLLRAVTDKGSIDRWPAAAALQGPEEAPSRKKAARPPRRGRR